MAEYEIICIRHDSNKVITHVGLRNAGVYTVAEIADRINRVVDTFFTYRGGQRAKVYARQRSDTGRWYLTTNPDSTYENNLDFLPYCSG